MKVLTLRITISTKDHIKDGAVNRIKQWALKKCKHAYIVVEPSPTGRRHLHAAVCLKAPAEGNDVVGYLWKIVKEYHPDAVRKVAMNKHVMYDHKWYDEYLRKEGSVEVVLDSYNKDEVARCFPTAEEQQQLMDHVVEATTDAPKDPYYDQLCRDWTEYDEDDTSYESAVKYLKYAMFAARTIRVISDQRRVCQTAWALWHYRNRRIEVDAGDKAYCNALTASGY